MIGSGLFSATCVLPGTQCRYLLKIYHQRPDTKRVWYINQISCILWKFRLVNLREANNFHHVLVAVLLDSFESFGNWAYCSRYIEQLLRYTFHFCIDVSFESCKVVVLFWQELYAILTILFLWSEKLDFRLQGFHVKHTEYKVIFNLVQRY